MKKNQLTHKDLASQMPVPVWPILTKSLQSEAKDTVSEIDAVFQDLMWTNTMMSGSRKLHKCAHALVQNLRMCRLTAPMFQLRHLLSASDHHPDHMLSAVDSVRTGSHWPPIYPEAAQSMTYIVMTQAATWYRNKTTVTPNISIILRSRCPAQLTWKESRQSSDQVITCMHFYIYTDIDIPQVIEEFARCHPMSIVEVFSCCITGCPYDTVNTVHHQETGRRKWAWPNFSGTHPHQLNPRIAASIISFDQPRVKIPRR